MKRFLLTFKLNIMITKQQYLEVLNRAEKFLEIKQKKYNTNVTRLSIWFYGCYRHSKKFGKRITIKI